MKPKTQISHEVDTWIAEEELPSRANFRPVRRFDGLYPSDPEEAEAYWDFQRWGMMKEHELIMSLPVKKTWRRWPPLEHDDAVSFPFGSVDFQNLRLRGLI